MKRNPKTRSQPKLALGIALIVLGAILISGSFKAPLPRSSSFASEPVEITGFEMSLDGETKSPKKLVITDLGIDIEVKPARLIDGYWEVFEGSAGWGEGSSPPGEKGNQVIFAHAREGLFKPLKNAKTGLRVYVLTEKEWFSYEVTEIKEVYPNQTEVIKPTEEEILTLYTCSGFADAKRLIVIAKRI